MYFENLYSLKALSVIDICQSKNQVNGAKEMCFGTNTVLKPRRKFVFRISTIKFSRLTLIIRVKTK